MDLLVLNPPVADSSTDDCPDVPSAADAGTSTASDAGAAYFSASIASSNVL